MYVQKEGLCSATTYRKTGGGGGVWAGLKVLSNEMEQAKEGSHWKVLFVKGEAWRFSANFARPHPLRTF